MHPACRNLAGMRIASIRGRQASRRSLHLLHHAGPDSARIRAFFVLFQPFIGSRIDVRLAALAATLHGSERSLTSCRKAASAWTEAQPSTISGCSSRGRAGPFQGQGAGSNPAIRSTSGVSKHSAPRSVVLAARDVHGLGQGMCSETPIRRDARVRAQPKWNFRSRWSSWFRTPDFQSGDRGFEPRTRRQSLSPR